MEFSTTSLNTYTVPARGCERIGVENNVIVPDSKPDIIKILQVDSEAVVTSRGLFDGYAQIEGRVDFKILYLPEKGSQSLCSISASVDFERRIEKDCITSECSIDTECDVDRLEFRLINSRKAGLKAVVILQYEILSPMRAELPTDASDGCEVKLSHLETGVLKSVSNHPFSVREELEIAPGQVSVGEILKTDIRVDDTEYKSVTGKLICRGTLKLCVLYTGTDAAVRFMDFDIPFTEVFDLDDTDSDEDETYMVKCRVCGVSCTAAEDSDGDMRLIDADISMEANIRRCAVFSEDYISDCYLIGEKSSLLTREITVENVRSLPDTRINMRESIAPPAKFPSISGIYHAEAKSVITSAKISGGRILIEGKTVIYILYTSSDGEYPVYSCRKEIPISTSVDAQGFSDDAEAEAEAEAEHLSWSLNAANEAELRYLLRINARIRSDERLSVIEDVEIEDTDDSTGFRVVIYFVQNGDTLWDVAKRYTVPVNTLCEMNSVSPSDPPAPGKGLLIPISLLKD